MLGLRSSLSKQWKKQNSSAIQKWKELKNVVYSAAKKKMVSLKYEYSLKDVYIK